MKMLPFIVDHSHLLLPPPPPIFFPLQPNLEKEPEDNLKSAQALIYLISSVMTNGGTYWRLYLNTNSDAAAFHILIFNIPSVLPFTHPSHITPTP
jgi:hypothetical protein